MERVLSVEDISWASSSSSQPTGAGSSEANMMNRSPSEWAFQRFLQEAMPSSPSSSRFSNADGPHSRSLDPTANADAKASVQPSPVSGRTEAAGGDEAQEDKATLPPSTAGLPRRSDVPADSDVYHEFLKQQLNLACAAAAAVLSRASVARSQESVTSTGPKCCASEASQLDELGNITDENKGDGSVPALQRSSSQARPSSSCTSRELSDDEELDEETEMTQNRDPADEKRVRRMLSNRESARRSRKRKQAHLTELEGQVSQLKVENSSLLKRLTEMNQKFSEAAVNNRILKADVETLRAKVKMAEETVKRVTGWKPMHPNMPDMSALAAHLSVRTDEVSDATVPKEEGAGRFSEVPLQDKVVRQVDCSHLSAAGGKIGRSASIPRVASLEHLQKRIRGEPGPC